MRPSWGNIQGAKIMIFIGLRTKKTLKFFGKMIDCWYFCGKIIIDTIPTMKRLFTVIIMLLPLCVFAQGKSAMYYYYKGCELLNAGKYEESVPYFRQCESLYQARFKPTTKKNNKTASKIAACQSALGVVAGLMGNPYEALRLTSSAADLL